VTAPSTGELAGHAVTTPAAAWQQLAPLLAKAMAPPREADRNAAAIIWLAEVGTTALA